MRNITFEHRFWEKVNGHGECWDWEGSLSGFGHGQIRQGGKNGGSLLIAHRVAFEMVNGPIPEGMCVLHRCDNPRCVRPAHLFLGTRYDNTHDMIDKGRYRGRKSNCLTTEQAKAILLSAEPVKLLALKFNITADQIYRIKNHRSWTGLSPG